MWVNPPCQRNLGQERVIVSDIAGTTRDARHSLYREGQRYLLIDTAGIRRKSNIELSTERYSVIRALRAIDRCDVVLMVIDATTGVTEQDKRIVDMSMNRVRVQSWLSISGIWWKRTTRP